MSGFLWILGLLCFALSHEQGYVAESEAAAVQANENEMLPCLEKEAPPATPAANENIEAKVQAQTQAKTETQAKPKTRESETLQGKTNWFVLVSVWCLLPYLILTLKSKLGVRVLLLVCVLLVWHLFIFYILLQGAPRKDGMHLCHFSSLGNYVEFCLDDRVGMIRSERKASACMVVACDPYSFLWPFCAHIG